MFDNCVVVGITDGDTITVKKNYTSYKIRLSEIDAPERKQSFGTAAKIKLSEKIFGKNIVFEGNKKDRYGRIVAEVFYNGRNINQEMVEEGFAWVDERYSKSIVLLECQKKAKEKKIGLWSEKNPIPPWQFRKKL